MVWHGFLAKAVPTVVTGAVGVAAYEALRKMVGEGSAAGGNRVRCRLGHTLST
ncbi:irpA [Mycobacterium tuberculosis]|nr:irpA [Mycobacterium tuberculosis]